MDEVLPSFRGKVLFLSLDLRLGRDVQLLLRDPHLERQAGRWFLVGELVDNPRDPSKLGGQVCSVAWDTVSTYFVFNSIEDVFERLGVNPRRGWFG